MNERRVIKNCDKLISKGDCAARKPALETAELALIDLNSYNVLKRFLKRTKDRLYFGKNQWDLSKVRSIYVVGGGKAANAVATGALLVKFGAPRAGEKINKYNRLLQIQDDLGKSACFSGFASLLHKGGQDNAQNRV